MLSGLYLFAPGLSGNGLLINFLGLTGVLAIVAGIRMHKPAARAAWWLFAAGQFLFFSGDVYTYSYRKLLGAEVGFPSIGDALYLLVYPVLMAGLLILIRRRSPRPDRAALIDALILTIGIGLLSWVFLIAPNVHLGNLSLLANAVSVAYPLGDVLLLAAAIRLAVDAGKRSPAFWLLVSSIVCLMATDSAYNLALLKGTYHHQLIYDAGWIFYYLLWGAAALHPSMRSLEEPAVDSRTPLTPLRLTLLGAACLIAPGIRLRPVSRQPRRARSHRRVRSPLPPRRREDGRARPAGGARGFARARSAGSGRRARCRRRSRPGGDGRDLRGPSPAGSGAAGAPRADRAGPGRRRGLVRRGHRWSRG